MRFLDTTSAQPQLFGPALPSHLLNKQPQSSVDSFEPSSFSLEKEDSDDDTFGPLPPGLSPHSSAYIALEERALQLKMGRLQPKSDKPEREEWMIELPEVGDASKLGLGPRQFRKKAAPDLRDRSLVAFFNQPRNLQFRVILDPLGLKHLKLKERNRKTKKLILRRKPKRGR